MNRRDYEPALDKEVMNVNRRKSLFTVGVMFAFLLAGISGLHAADRGGLGLDLGYGKINRLLQFQDFIRGLNLTSEQRVQVRETVKGNRARILQAVRAVVQARMDMMKQTPNSGEEMASAVVQAMRLKKQIFEQIRPILTAEQWTKIQEKLQSREQRLQNLLNRLDARIAK
jgi:Spy/CpxP family protein refolding chaperone